jgi:hypothetical protein
MLWIESRFLAEVTHGSVGADAEQGVAELM